MVSGSRDSIGDSWLLVFLLLAASHTLGGCHGSSESLALTIIEGQPYNERKRSP
jgi:hypothetical protein